MLTNVNQYCHSKRTGQLLESTAILSLAQKKLRDCRAYLLMYRL